MSSAAVSVTIVFLICGKHGDKEVVPLLGGPGGRQQLRWMKQEHISAGQLLHSFSSHPAGSAFWTLAHLNIQKRHWRLHTQYIHHLISSPCHRYFPVMPQRELASKKDQSLLRCHPEFRPKVYRCIGSGFFGVPRLSLWHSFIRPTSPYNVAMVRTSRMPPKPLTEPSHLSLRTRPCPLPSCLVPSALFACPKRHCISSMRWKSLKPCRGEFIYPSHEIASRSSLRWQNTNKQKKPPLVPPSPQKQNSDESGLHGIFSVDNSKKAREASYGWGI